MLKTETDNNFENEKKVCSNCGAVASKNDTYCKKCYYEFKNDEEENLQVIEGIDNSTVREFVDKNYDYYREKFVRSGDKKFFIQFNLCAFLFGVHWFFYRKMYKVAIIYSAALILLSVLAAVVIPVVHRQDIKHYEVVREVRKDFINNDKAYYHYTDENGNSQWEMTTEYKRVSRDYDALKKVEFGTAMHTIGYRAFYSCDGLTTFTLPATFRKFGEECFFGCSGLREIRCLGPMPSFKARCLWDCPVSVFYPTTNPWPAEYVTPLYQSYQGKLQIFMGDGIEEAGKQIVEAAVTEPVTEPAETVPETTVPETTVPETTVPETVPETTMAETQPPEAESTQPEWMREMEEFQDTQEEQQQKKDSSGNIWFALCLITGTLCLILIGILVFRRRSY